MLDTPFRSAKDLAAAVRKKIGCLELLDLYLARVDKHNPGINAIIAMDVEGARKRARAADRALARKQVWGPLHGVPMTIKESYDVVGMPTTWGVPDLKGNLPPRNALAVDRLLGAGVVLFGKTNVPIYLADYQSYNAIYGTTSNPWDLARSPGGSSGGSADISVIGPMARSAEDLEIGLGVMAGPDDIDAAGYALRLPAPRQKTLRDFKIAVILTDLNSEVDAEVQAKIQAVADFLAGKRAKVSDRARPDIDTNEAARVYIHLLRAATSGRQTQEEFDKNVAAGRALRAGDESYYGRMVRGSTTSHRDWLAANEARQKMRYRWAEFFKEYDLLLCPAAASAAFPHDHAGERHERTIEVNGRRLPTTDQLFWAGYSGMAYLPGTVAPAGQSRSGLPVGVQIVGPQYGDRTCIQLARLLEREYQGFVPPPAYA